MLKLINITKNYKTRKNNVEALKGIDLELPNEGMVFITGKSGCGKSTLLNIMSGLDNYSSGELIIDNKSINNFKNTDYDSYRNTHVGVIFQEYNLLEDLTVYKNLEIALELQNKKIDREKIENLLNDLELEGYGYRKVTELSGGQRQRVAIARALIKNPRIILADEPTGALDSETGEQVFDLLKRISTDVLVIVVSHDEESAVKYADRLINMEDGLIVGDKIINELKTSKIIENTSFIKSKLPLKSVSRIAISSFRNKIVKLIIIVLISMVSFGTFGVVDSINGYKAPINLANFSKLDDNFVSISSADWYKNDGNMKISDFDNIKEKFNNTKFNNVYSNKLENFPSLNELVYDNFSNDTIFSSLNNQGIISIGNDFLKENEFDIIGKIPTDYNEIALSTYSYEGFKKYGFRDIYTNSLIEINTPDDLIGLDIRSKDSLAGRLTITGIIDTEFRVEDYSLLNDENANYEMKKYTKNKLINMHNFSYNRMFFVSKKFNTGVSSKKFVTNEYSYIMNSISGKMKLHDIENSTHHAFFNSYNKESIDENNIMVSMDVLNRNGINAFIRTIYNQKLDNYISTISANEIRTILKEIINDDSGDDNDVKNRYNTLLRDKLYLYNKYGKSGVSLFKESIEEALYEKNMQVTLNLPIYKLDGTIETVEKNIIGIDYSTYHYHSNESEYIVANDTFYESLGEDIVDYNVCVGIIASSKNLSKKTIRKLFDKNYINDGKEEKLKYNNTLFEDGYDSLTKGKWQYALLGLAVGGILLIFSILLISSYISNSILFKKREIGILRTIGARGKDVFKIFLLESIILSVVISLLSTIVSIILVSIFNSYLNKSIGVNLNYYAFGIRQVIVVLITGIIISFIAVFIPARKVSKKKPIDLIKTN